MPSPWGNATAAHSHLRAALVADELAGDQRGEFVQDPRDPSGHPLVTLGPGAGRGGEDERHARGLRIYHTVQLHSHSSYTQSQHILDSICESL